MLSLRHRFLFIHIPKTAGNAVQSALLPYSEDRMALTSPNQDGVERFNIHSPHADVVKHSTLGEYAAQLPGDLFAGLFKFTCMRNPWDRCVSYFFSPHRGTVPWSSVAFADVIRRQVRPAQAFLAMPGAVGQDAFDNLDTVLRYEQLEGDFRRACGTIGIEAPKLPRINASPRRDYREYYVTAELVDLVAAKFAVEIARFGYTFEGPAR